MSSAESPGPRRVRRPAVKGEVRELLLLFEISQVLDTSLDLREVVGPVLRALAHHMGMERGTISLLNRETGDIHVEAAYGLSPDARRRGRYRVGEGVTGQVVARGEAMVVPRISDEPWFLDRTESRQHLERKDIAFICVPIKQGNEVLGALSADRLFHDRPDFQEDARLLSIIASMLAQAVRLRQAAQEARERLEQENRRLRGQLAARFRPENIIGRSKRMQAVFELMGQVAPTEATVLLQGESGVGKERVAEAIHFASRRRNGPLVRVNCGAIPETLIESELFGHVRGAFTGAVAQRPGHFESAAGGTIFLDEIGDMPPATQVRLLRVLQEREVQRVGATEAIPIDVRVIAGSNRDLEALAAEGCFRQDLFFRLNVFPILIPPLRERPTDIPLLVEHFVSRFQDGQGRRPEGFTQGALSAMEHYPWPGNVRELENCIERAVLLAGGELIDLEHLPPALQRRGPLPPSLAAAGSLPDTLDAVERELIEAALEEHRGNMRQAARALGISERIMGLRVRKHGIDARAHRPKRQR